MRRERRNFQGAAGDSVSNTAQPTKGKEIMGKRVEDLKETAPCGMLIHYTVNEEDMITYNDINGRGVHCDKCDGCTWKGICKPEEPKKAMSHKTYIEIYNLIDDAMQEAGEKVEEACNKLAKSDADPKCVLACNMVEQIKKYQKRYNEMKALLERFEAEVEVKFKRIRRKCIVYIRQQDCHKMQKSVISHRLSAFPRKPFEL